MDPAAAEDWLHELRLVAAYSGEEWARLNTTGILYLLRCLAGAAQSSEERQLLIGIMHSYILWRQTKPADFVPLNGIQVMYPVACLHQCLSALVAPPPPEGHPALLSTVLAEWPQPQIVLAAPAASLPLWRRILTNPVTIFVSAVTISVWLTRQMQRPPSQKEDWRSLLARLRTT